MISYSLADLAKVLNAEAYISKEPHSFVHELFFDSRRFNQVSGSLFIALKTSRNDGHRYIPELIRKGITNFIVEKLPEKELIGEANFIRVDNSLDALQKIAAFHRRKFSFPLIGITGSNGKTIVKEWLYELLKDAFRIVRSPKSFNSQIGVPVSVWQMDAVHTLGIIEAGISAPGEMEALEEIIHPEIGIFTNIGSAHAENFPDRKSHILEKLILFKNSKKLIYCSDLAEKDEVIRNNLNIELITWGGSSNATFRITNTSIEQEEAVIYAAYKGNFLQFRIPFTDAASIENAVHCIVLMLELGMDVPYIQSGLPRLHRVEMRLELRKGIYNCTIINDSYSADTESLRIAVDFMMQQKQHQRRTVILSDILESGKEPAKLYPEVAALLERKGVYRLIGVGEQLTEHSAAFWGEKMFFPSTEALLKQLPAITFRDECILLKGARIFEFERIVDALQQKTHETILEINLSALESNLNFYRSQLKPGVKTMAMVKAFSYGSGSFEIANVLQYNNVDYLAVAYADEGIELRQAGISLPIMVMNPEQDSFPAMIEHRLEPEIYNFRILEQFSRAMAQRDGYDAQKTRVHIKLDTGMHRLGFEEKDLEELVVRLKKLPWLEVAAVFSHLAASSEAQHDEFTKLQISRFVSWTNVLRQGIEDPFLMHMANSSGIIRHPESQFDMVRLGIGLYGIAGGTDQSNLVNVSSLKTTISQIREVAAGESVGYGRKAILDRPSRIATLPVGYADGFGRKLGNGKAFLKIRKKEAPTVGSICMDMCMVDVTDIPSAREGDQVIVFDSPADIQRLAGWLETIPYEVLTNISGRVKRVYFQE